MTDRDRFLAAIRATPDDDTPRLAFADWLCDTADPPEPERAAFIRWQVQREPHNEVNIEPGCSFAYSPTALSAGGRMPVELFSNRLPGFTGRLVVRRGFLEYVVCSAIEWYWFGESLGRVEPIVRGVVITHWSDLRGIIEHQQTESVFGGGQGHLFRVAEYGWHDERECERAGHYSGTNGYNSHSVYLGLLRLTWPALMFIYSPSID